MQCISFHLPLKADISLTCTKSSIQKKFLYSKPGSQHWVFSMWSKEKKNHKIVCLRDAQGKFNFNIVIPNVATMI